MTGAGWVAFAGLGSRATEFAFPTGLAVDAAGRLYVTDEMHRVVRIDDMTGAGWTAFGTMGGGVGQFFFPSGIAVTPAGR
jgi:DNA-binding beta-propeller fold protein YncE